MQQLAKELHISWTTKPTKCGIHKSAGQGQTRDLNIGETNVNTKYKICYLRMKCNINPILK